MPAPEAPPTILWTSPIAGRADRQSTHRRRSRVPRASARHRRGASPSRTASSVWQRGAAARAAARGRRRAACSSPPGEAIHALQRWRWRRRVAAPAGTLTAPLLVKDGWVIAATAGKLTALRADRRQQPSGRRWPPPQREARRDLRRHAVRAVADGRSFGRAICETGDASGAAASAGTPGEPLVVGDSLLVGATDKRFYSLDADDRRDEVALPRSAPTSAAALATDGERVFFTALDNLVRALDRGQRRAEMAGRVAVPADRPARSSPASTVFIAGPGTDIADAAARSTASPPERSQFPARLGRRRPAMRESELRRRDRRRSPAVSRRAGSCWRRGSVPTPSARYRAAAEVAASSSRTVAASRATPSRILSCDGAENDEPDEVVARRRRRRTPRRRRRSRHCSTARAIIASPSICAGSVAQRKNPPRGAGQVTSRAELARQRVHHHVALLLVVPAQQRQLALEDAAAAALRRRRADRARRCRGPRPASPSRTSRRAAPAHRSTRRGNPGASVFEKLLRYTTRPLVSSARDRPDVRFGRRVLEVQLAIGIVLDEQDVAALGPLEQLACASRGRSAGRSGSGSWARRRACARAVLRAAAACQVSSSASRSTPSASCRTPTMLAWTFRNAVIAPV